MFPLEAANDALAAISVDAVRGAAVLTPALMVRSPLRRDHAAVAARRAHALTWKLHA